LRHDRTVHAKDGGTPLGSEGKRRSGPKTSLPAEPPIPSFNDPKNGPLDEAADDDDEDEEMDDEAAAILINNLHHQAMGNQAAEPKLEPTSPQLPLPAPTIVEPPVSTFGSGQMSLPQMPWDSLMPQSLTDAQGRTIATGNMQPHDPTAFSATNMVDSHPVQLPPILEQNLLSSDGLPNFNTTMSGLGTPGALSPFPGMLGPVSPVDYRRSPGPSQQLTITKAPQLTADEQWSRIHENIKRLDLEVALLETFQLPSRFLLNRYLSTYFNLFHHHLPFLHPPSFNPTEVAAPLLLAVLSIGALYSFEQDQAFMLHIGSKVLVNQFLQKKENFSSRKCPLWTMQATLLNMIFASWSGDPKGLEWACSIKSLLANMVSGNRYELRMRTEARGYEKPSHHEWILDEECRRSYYAVYIFFGMSTLTFNHTPSISYNELDTLELPSSETLWSLESTDRTWQDRYNATSIITYQEAHDRLLSGQITRYSAFGTRVMINALFVEGWNHQRGPNALQDVVHEHKLRLGLETWQKSLDICEPETVIVQLSAPHKGHPLIFNAMAMYRNTRARLLVDLRSIQEALRYHDSFEVAAAMTNARAQVVRSHEMIKVIQECFDCIEIAAMQGIRWVARTSATNWSVEHPLCGLDLIVILSLWLWRVEHDQEPPNDDEQVMYDRIKNLFDADTADTYGSRLSTTVARLWGSMVDEVVVWGITKLIGESFKLHAQALGGYENSLLRQRNGELPGSQPLAPQALEMQAAY